MKYLFAGLLFSILWASASVATKIGLESVPPLFLATCRFFIAGMLLLTYAIIRGQYRRPTPKEWKQLSIFGLLNTTVYLSLYVYAMKYTAAGIGSLAVSTNPLLIVLLSAWLMGRKASIKEWIGIILGIAGVYLATIPLLEEGHTTSFGLLLLGLSMLAVSFASVYYAQIQWHLPNILINGWQVTLGGLFLLPFTLLTTNVQDVHLDTNFWYGVLWLSIGVSVFGLICWFYLLKIDTVKAALWLFLCPIFGFFYAWWLMDEPITWYTLLGSLLVIFGLYLSQTRKLRVKT